MRFKGIEVKLKTGGANECDDGGRRYGVTGQGKEVADVGNNLLGGA